MSRTVENRVVQMQFENKQFEDAVAESRQSIQLLEKDLKLLEGVQALKNIDLAVQSIDVSSIAKGIETLNDRFSTLGIIGMTVTQNLTNAVTGGLLGAVNSVASAIKGVFSNIMQRGFNRATNIEQAKFSLQGLLTSQYGDNLAKIEERTAAISKAIDESVTDTAYGYDQAARAASTLVATYGSTDEGVSRVLAALNGIAGVAAQTGASYDQVAQVFTTVAGNGRVMGMQLNQIAGYGLNAAKAIADYINEDTAASRKIKKNLKIRGDATEAEVRELVSRGKITADIFNEAFYVFRQNAGRANETVSGVMSNINAAIGRIGAAFIEPIIANQGPWVGFLNEVRLLVKDIANIITKDFKIPEKTTALITNLLEKTTEVLHTFRETITESDIFRRFNNITETLKSAFDLSGATEEAKENATKFSDIYIAALKRWEESTSGTYKTFSEFVDDVLFDITGLKSISSKSLNEEDSKIVNLLASRGTTISEVYERARELLNAQNNGIVEAYDSIADSSEVVYKNVRATEKVWETDYFKNIIDAFTNFGEAFSNIGNVISNAIGEGNPKLKEFLDILSGNETGQFKLRVILNEVSESFLNFSEKVKIFTESETGIGIINGLTAAFIFLSNALTTAFKMVGIIITSFTPIFDRILHLFGAVGDTIYDLNNSANEFDIWAVILENTAKVADFLASVIIFLWDTVADFLNIFSPKDLEGIIESLIEFIKKVGNYIKTNIPIWFEKARPYIEKFVGALVILGKFIADNLPIWIEKASPYIQIFGKKILEVGEFLSDVLGEGLSLVSPYIEKFAGWLSEATDGAVDLENPIETVNTLLEENSDTLGTVNSIAGTVSNTLETVSETVEDVGKHMEGPTKAIGGLVETFENLEKKTGFIHNWGTSTGNSVEDARKPWQKFKDTVTMIYNTVTDWTRKRLDEFGILEDGKTLGEKLKEFFGSVIDAIKNFDYDKALNFLTTLGTKLGIVFGIFAAAIGHINITKAVAGIPGMFNNISTTIRSFSPFYADVMKADNATTRREAMADILKSFAFVIISIATAIGVMVWAIDKLSSLSAEGKLDAGMAALQQIMWPLIGIIAMLIIFMAIVAGKDRSVTTVDKLPGVASAKGLKKFINLMQNGGLGSETKTVTSQGQNAWKSIAAIAGVIIAFAAAVGIITLAISKLGSLSPGQLEQGMSAFYEIASIIAILLILVGAFALILRGGTESSTNNGFGAAGNRLGFSNLGGTRYSSRDSADWKVIAALAVAMLLISAAISGLMLSIAIISNIPTKDLEKGLYIFWEVVKAVAGIIVVLGVMAALMTFFNKGSKGVAGTIIGMAVLMAVIGLIIGGLMQIIVEIAFLPIEDVTIALDILNDVTGAIIAIITILGVFLAGIAIIAMLGNKNGEVTKAMLSVSLVIAMIAALFVAIGFSIILIGTAIGEIALAFYALDENKLDSIVAIIGILAGMVVLVMAAVAVMVGLAKANKDMVGITLILLGVAVIFGALALLFYSIGTMAKMIADSGMDVDALMGIVITVTVLVGLVMAAVVAIVLLCATGVGEGILGTLAIITAMFAAIGFMFIGIGAAAYLIGSGIDILVDAFIKFFTFIESLNEDKTTRVQSNLERFMYGLGTIIFAGLLGIASFLDTNRERVVDAIKKIVKFIMEAILASVVQTFETGLDSLGEMIDIFDTWLNQHAFEIERIITNVGNIIFTAIDNFMDNLMKLILGENYDGGTDGYLGQVTQGIIKWLYTYFLNDDAVGRTLLADLFRVIGEQAHDGIIEFFDLIINSQDIPTKALEAVDSVIVGITNGLITYGPQIIDHVKELGRVVWQLILYMLGISDVPPQSSMFGVTGGATKGDPEGVMDDMADSMMTELSTIDWLDAVGDFLSNLWNAMIDVAEGIENRLPGSGGLLGLGRRIANLIIDGTYQGLDNGSPSRRMEQQGIWAVEGLYNGLNNRRRNRDLYNSAINIANVVVGGVAGAMTLSNTTENFINGMTKELSKLKTRLAPLFDGLLEGIDAKISPYMDLTQIEEGFGSIQDMMNGNSSFDISALNSGNISDLSSTLTDSDIAVGTAEGFDDANSPDLGILGNVDTETIVNFTQNNYSPESLDRIDIYRDTKNLFNNPTLLGNVARMLHSGGGGGSF